MLSSSLGKLNKTSYLRAGKLATPCPETSWSLTMIQMQHRSTAKVGPIDCYCSIVSQHSFMLTSPSDKMTPLSGFKKVMNRKDKKAFSNPKPKLNMSYMPVCPETTREEQEDGKDVYKYQWDLMILHIGYYTRVQKNHACMTFWEPWVGEALELEKDSHNPSSGISYTLFAFSRDYKNWIQWDLSMSYTTL